MYEKIMYLRITNFKKVNMENSMESRPKSEIILYQPNETVSLEVRLDEDTVWLTQQQIAELFGVNQPAISKHIANVYKSGELEEKSTYSILEYMGNDGKQMYKIKFYNLDMILSVGYRVNSRNATLFRQWANKILKEYLLRGYSVNQRLQYVEERMDKRFSEHEKILQEHSEQIAFFVKTNIPPKEGIIFEGQVFDARACVENLIKEAQNEVIMIDAYVDASTFEMLDVRSKGVAATIYTERVTHSLQRIKELHDAQYPDRSINLAKYSENFHDRFLIIDDIVYHFGASFKDLGKRLFAFNKMGLEKDLILSAVR